MSLETATQESAPAPSNGPIGASDLVGMFRAELDAETPSNTETPSAAPQQQAAADEPADLAQAQPDPDAEADPVEAEQQDGPETDPATAAIVAPSGMSAADKAVFDALPPDAKAWIAKRESESRADYTKKTQAVAEQRKSLEAANTQVLEQIKQYDAFLSRFTTQTLQPPDPALSYQDPTAYQEQLAQYVHAKHQQDIAKSEQDRIRKEASDREQAAMKQFWSEQQQELQRLAPDLAADTPQAKATRNAVADYGVKQGYTKEQLEMATARDMVTLWKAQRYDAAMAAKADVKPVVNPAPKVMAPGPAKAGARSSAFAASVKAFSDNTTRAGLVEAYRAELASER